MEYIYAALLLHKLGKEVNEENVKKVVAATGESVDDTKVKSLIAGLNGVDIAAELANASVASSAPASSAAPAEKKEEEKPKEEKKEAAAEGLASLFG
jgi:large subunit ribosomal protein L12